MKKLIYFMLVISIVTMNNSVLYAATGQSTCDLVTASENTTANCDQKILSLENGSFEDLGNLSFANNKQTNEANVAGWDTTASDNTIELWTKSFYERQQPDADSSPIDGDIIAELNANSVAALYQDFETEPGQIINIYTKHGGRIHHNIEGDQNLGVYVGEPRTDYSDTNYSAALYPTKGLSNDLMYSSTVAPGEWNEIAFQYVVPEGQTTTRIAFNSLDSGSLGNFIDDVKVGVDSIYDNEVTIESVTGGNSFADTYRVTNVLNHIGGDAIGKFEVYIDTSGLKNLRQFEIRDMNNNDVTNLATVEYVEEDHIKISGNSFVEGTVTFVAESALEETGEIVVDSDLKYVSELYLDFIRLGQILTDGVLETRDIASVQLVDEPPVISFENITVNEAELSNGINVKELLKIAVEDKEDNLKGFNTIVTIEEGTIDFHKPGVYNVNITATDGEGQTTTETATITIIDLLPEIMANKDTVELHLNEVQELTKNDFISLFDVVAKEISTGDLTTQISVDFSEVNFNATGTYNVYFKVTDEEGNETNKTTNLVITRSTLGDTGLIDNTVDPLPVVDSEIDGNDDTVVSEVETSDTDTTKENGDTAVDEDNETNVDVNGSNKSKSTKEKSNTATNEVIETNVDVNGSNKSKSTKEKLAEVNEQNRKHKEMTLTNTGRKSMFIFLIAILLGLISIKKLSNKKASINL